MLTPGTPAPDFSLPDADGNMHSLADYRGQKVALYFYPKDDTPGCTAQACNLRDNIALLKKAGIQVLGLSTDSVKSHKKFEEKFSLPFPLLADADRQVVESYGLWGEKKFMGKTYMGTSRHTFLIDEDGMIAHIIDKVDTKDHTKQVLDTWEVDKSAGGK
jgi:peroxiredoxin Q/BCP